MSVAQAARDLNSYPNALRNWVEALLAGPQYAFPDPGWMKLDQREIGRLRRAIVKLTAERDI